MADLAVLRQAHEAGLTVWVEGTHLQVEGEPTPKALAAVETLREHKAEVLSFLRKVSDGQLPSLGRPPQTEQELRRWMDYTADREAFAQWLDWAINYTDIEGKVSGKSLDQRRRERLWGYR
jgi:hypothetical protein